MYLVSSGRFSHPISRRELGRQEVAALDAHLHRHSLHHGVTEVARIYDRQVATDPALTPAASRSPGVVQGVAVALAPSKPEL